MQPVHRDALQRLAQNKLGDAEALCRAAVLRDPADAMAWYITGLCALKRDSLLAGIALLEKALALNPAIAEAHQNLGVALSRIGAFDAASEHWRAAIRVNPNSGECYQYLSEIQALAVDDDIFAAARTLADDQAQNAKMRQCAAFAVGTALHAAGKYGDAFDYFALGNRLADAKPDVARERKLLERSRAVFTPELFARLAPLGERSIRPIFVVGMPRSGTTLVEQILASHSRLGAAGELADITGMVGSLGKIARGMAYPGILEKLPADVLGKIFRDFAQQYGRRLEKVAPGAERVVDKAPNNYRFLGLVAALFPEARIIYCRRSPMDVGLSCFQANFVKGQPWSFSFEGIADKLKVHAAFMAFWQEVLPLPIHTVHYETLVAQTAAEARKLTDFCGVAWEAGCAQPHRNAGEVQTASKWQVRQPVNARSVERWRRYESELAPLRAAIAELLEEGA